MRHFMEKVGKIFNLFSFQHPEWGVSEAARVLDIPKSTTSEILASLAEQGLLSRTNMGRYQLGWRFFELNHVLLANTPFCIEARQVMQELVERWGETTHLAVLNGPHILYVEKLQGTPAVQILLSRVGARLPAYCSGVGKVLLAYQEWKYVMTVFADQELVAFTSHTITTLDALEKELTQIRQQGYSYDHEEVVRGLCCVAAPIHDFDGHILAAISISVPAYRFYPQQENYTAIILKAAQSISNNLGYRKDT